MIYLKDSYIKKFEEKIDLILDKTELINKKLIKNGYQADLLFWEVENMYDIPYWFNSSNLSKILKKGKLITL